MTSQEIINAENRLIVVSIAVCCGFSRIAPQSDACDDGLERFNFEYASEILKSPDQRRKSTGKLKVSAE